MLDLRLPSGFYFAITGAILIGAGLIAGGTEAPLQNANVNLLAGAAMLVFGGILLLLAKRARS